MVDEISDWMEYLSDESDDRKGALFVRHVDTGRPLGDNAFIEKLESLLKITLKKKRAGRRKKEK